MSHSESIRYAIFLQGMYCSKNKAISRLDLNLSIWGLLFIMEVLSPIEKHCIDAAKPTAISFKEEKRQKKILPISWQVVFTFVS